MTDFGEKVAELAGIVGGERERARVLALDAITHHMSAGRPTCGAGDLEWVHGVSDWSKVTCSNCVRAGGA